MKRTAAMVAGLSVALLPLIARAHVSIVSGPGFANTTQEIVFGVGHGCAGADTYKVRVEIPTEVLSLRPMRSDFCKVSLEKDAAGTITAVPWQKEDPDPLDAHIAYYELVIRLKVPKKAFHNLILPAQKTCPAWNGTLTPRPLEKAPQPILGLKGGRKKKPPPPPWGAFPPRKPGLKKLGFRGARFQPPRVFWGTPKLFERESPPVTLISGHPNCNSPHPGGINSLTPLWRKK